MMFNRTRQIILLATMLLSSLISIAFTPVVDQTKRLPTGTFASQIPEGFAGWQHIPSQTINIDLYQKTNGERTTDNPYDDSIIRTYQHSDGQTVQLAIAYGALQKQEVKIHRPDLCYYAQGYDVKSLENVRFSLPNDNDGVQGNKMIVQSGSTFQLVSYWIRIGSLFSQNAWQTRLYLIKEGLLGRVPDGVLVRVSSTLSTESQHHDTALIQQAFINDLTNAIQNKSVLKLLLGEQEHT